MKKILFLLFFNLLTFNNSLFAIDIELNGNINLISGTDCQIASYRLGTLASYQGEDIDLIVDVIQEDNEYSNGNCVEISSNVLSFRIKDTDNDDTEASVDIKVTVVKKNTTIPIIVDQLNITNFDLDRSNNFSASDTDDVYYKNPSKIYLSENTNVTKSNGNFFSEYNVKLKGQATGNCDDDATTITEECRAGVIYNETASFYARIQNDNAYSPYPQEPYAHCLIQFSFEVKDLTPLIPDEIELSCGIYNYVSTLDSWIEGTESSTYKNELDVSQTIHILDAQELQVTVTGETEASYDFVTIFNEAGAEQYRKSGVLDTNSFIISGSTLTLQLTTDHSQIRQGANIHIEGLGCATYDFGDAPHLSNKKYPHVSHKISNSLYLGNSVPDAEDDQQSTADASGDGDDEDGVVSLEP